MDTITLESCRLLLWNINVINIFIFLLQVQYQFEWTPLYCTVNNNWIVQVSVMCSWVGWGTILCYCWSALPVCVCVHRLRQSIVAAIPYVRLGLTLWTARHPVTAEICEKHFGLERFSPRNFCIWFILLRKTALFSTVFIQFNPLCNCYGHLVFLNNMVKKLRSSKSQYFYRLWILHWSDRQWE